MKQNDKTFNSHSSRTNGSQPRLSKGEMLLLGVGGIRKIVKKKKIPYEKFKSKVLLSENPFVNYLVTQEKDKILRFQYDPKNLKIIAGIVNPETLTGVEVIPKKDSRYEIHKKYLNLSDM